MIAEANKDSVRLGAKEETGAGIRAGTGVGIRIGVGGGHHGAGERYAYLDWAAATPLRAEVAREIEPYLCVEATSSISSDTAAFFANTNSLHTPGRGAFARMEEARSLLARSLGASRPDEIIFTSGATEANNAALLGLVSAAVKQRRLKGEVGFVPHIITTQIEHESILAVTRVLKSLGCEITYLKPDKQGRILPEAVEVALTPSTVLVSVQWVNNEVGSINPIPELTSLTQKRGILFHSDAVQALGKIPLCPNLKDSGIDALSFSAHKIGGPKGMGFLYLKARTPFDAFLSGGGQEGGRRSGTHNLPGIVGCAKAVELACSEQESEARRLTGLRDELYRVLGGIPRVHATVDVFATGAEEVAGRLGAGNTEARLAAGNTEARLAAGNTESGGVSPPRFAPHIVHLCVEGFESETLILRLDERGFAVSGGSACSSASLEPSYVLRALDIPASRIQGALRISLGKESSDVEIRGFLKAFRSVVCPTEGSIS